MYILVFDIYDDMYHIIIVMRIKCKNYNMNVLMIMEGRSEITTIRAD